METTTYGEPTDTENRPVIDTRQVVDEAVAELADTHDLDHRELAAALIEARDTLLVTGCIPEWFGDLDAPQYASMNQP